MHEGPTGQVDPAAHDPQSRRRQDRGVFPRGSDQLGEVTQKLLFIQWLR
jgi:hypothetical protein